MKKKILKISIVGMTNAGKSTLINNLVGEKKSIHLENFNKFPDSFRNNDLNAKWLELIKIRDICNLSIEDQRGKKIIGSSLEASLNIKLNKRLMEIIKDIDLAELCITSSCTVEESNQDEVLVIAEKAKGNKCPVCWKISQKPCLRHDK